MLRIFKTWKIVNVFFPFDRESITLCCALTRTPPSTRTELRLPQLNRLLPVVLRGGQTLFESSYWPWASC
eukprot:237858-Pyramimonas_sp.AAC.1